MTEAEERREFEAKLLRLREIAAEISREGHNGWGNEIRDISDRLGLARSREGAPPRDAEIAALREALSKLIESSRCIKHWHDWGKDNEGMVVSSEHVMKLWAVRDEAERVLAKDSCPACGRTKNENFALPDSSMCTDAWHTAKDKEDQDG